MKDKKETKEQLISELAEMRQRIAELEKAEVERKRAEEALLQSEERFRTIVETAPSLLLVCDADGNNIYVSPNCEEIAGYTQEELLGRVVWWVHEDDTPRVKEVYDRTFRQAVGCKDVEYKAVKKNGELWYGSSSWEPIKDAEGNLAGVVFQTIDITERKRAEEALKEHSERLEEMVEERTRELQESELWMRSMFNSLEEAVFVVTPDRMLVNMNAAAQGMFGYSKDELVDLSADVLHVDHEHYLEFGRRIREAFDKGRTANFQFELERKNGDIFPTEHTVSLLKNDVGEPMGIVSVVRDITERKEMEEQLVRQERLAMLGQLAGGVGHELRNPLGVISNAVYYLQTTLPDADETTKEYFEMISSEVRHSEKVVSDLLDLSRAKPAERGETEVSTLVAHLLKKQPPPEKVKVTTRIASDLPPAFADPRQIEQVLTNLVINAYQAMPEGGRLTIEARAEKGQVYLSITDTGCGIPQENMERLFEPLFTTKAKGIGLGLAVSKNLVEANEGSIEVESKEGKGSTFTVILPTKEAQA